MAPDAKNRNSADDDQARLASNGILPQNYWADGSALRHGLEQPGRNNLGSQLLHEALARRLVGPPPQEFGAVSKAPGGDMVVADFRDQFGSKRAPFARAFAAPPHPIWAHIASPTRQAPARRVSPPSAGRGRANRGSWIGASTKKRGSFRKDARSSRFRHASSPMVKCR